MYPQDAVYVVSKKCEIQDRKNAERTAFFQRFSHAVGKRISFFAPNAPSGSYFLDVNSPLVNPVSADKNDACACGCA